MSILTDLLEEHTPFDQFDPDMDPWGKCGCGEEMHYESWPKHVEAEIEKLSFSYVTVTHPNGFSHEFACPTDSLTIHGDQLVITLAERTGE